MWEVPWKVWGTVFQEEGKASTKSLRQEPQGQEPGQIPELDMQLGRQRSVYSKYEGKSLKVGWRSTFEKQWQLDVLKALGCDQISEEQLIDRRGLRSRPHGVGKMYQLASGSRLVFVWLY